MCDGLIQLQIKEFPWFILSFQVLELKMVDLLGVTHYVPLFRHTLQPYSVVGFIRNDVQPYHIQK